MESRGREISERSEQSGEERGLPSVYEWLGKIIILSYMAGPDLADIEDPYDIARAQPEAREGIFGLEEVSNLGIVARKIVRDEEGLGPPIFFPWSAIQAIQELGGADDSAEGEEPGERQEP